MPKPLPPLNLSTEEQDYLKTFMSGGKRSARAIKRARILHYRHAGKRPKEASALADVSLSTVYNICERSQQEGLEAALAEKARPGQPSKLDLRSQAELTVVACSEAPAGHARWTVRLLADKAVELGIVDRIAPETIRQFLKKTNLSLG
jgi:putative transposase